MRGMILKSVVVACLGVAAFLVAVLLLVPAGQRLPWALLGFTLALGLLVVFELFVRRLARTSGSADKRESKSLSESGTPAAQHSSFDQKR